MTVQDLQQAGGLHGYQWCSHGRVTKFMLYNGVAMVASQSLCYTNGVAMVVSQSLCYTNGVAMVVTEFMLYQWCSWQLQKVMTACGTGTRPVTRMSAFGCQQMIPSQRTTYVSK